MINVKPRVSVMIPVFEKHEEAINCIKSVTEQSYTNIQIVVSDDSKTSKLEELINLHVSDQRIEYIHNSPSLGRVGNYYDMLHNRVKGDWFLNVDGDDVLTNRNFLEDCVKAINRYSGKKNLSLVFGYENIEYKETGKVKRRFNQLNSERYFKASELFFDKNRIGAAFYHLSSLMRTDVARNRNAYADECLGSDTLAIFRTIYENDCLFIDSLGGTWVSHGENESYDTSLSQLKQNLNAVNLMANEIFSDTISITEIKWIKEQLKSRLFRFLSHFKSIRKLLLSYKKVSMLASEEGLKVNDVRYAYLKVIFYRIF